MTTINENKFYQALESIFTGANIEGDSGYVNLLKIKSSYYKLILEEFKKSVNNEQIITDSFKEEFFDKLYSFFEKYFSESGSVYFVKTANWQRMYEQVYTDNKDVVLFWKTHMLYYVKSDILFQSIDVHITDEESKQDYHFFFDVGNLQAKQNNEKKALIFSFREIKEEKDSVDVINGKQGKKTFVFDVSYSERGNKIKIDDIIKATKIPEAIIEKAFATFKKQSEVDFFINKNAEKFLTEQLDMYLHQILLNEENKFEQKRLDQLKIIKSFALKIIKFISQFEDELVRVWNKPKFALNSNYVITIDKLSDEIITKIAKHKNLQGQIKEWQELGMVDEKFTFNDLENNDLLKTKNDKYTFLPIDTKYFKDLEIEILSVFDNLDEALDGRLIHSENYQALNTLQEKYKEKVQCIYIDPPFNTGSDFAYIDKFQDSTWLSLMHDRIELARKFLRDDGSFYLHLDEDADYLGRLLSDKVFGKENFINEIIWKFDGPQSPSPIKFAKKKNNILRYLRNGGNGYTNELYYYEIEEFDPKKYKQDENGNYYDTLPIGDYSDESIKRLDSEGKIFWTGKGSARLKKVFQLSEDGKFLLKLKKIPDIWTDITSMGHAGGLEKLENSGKLTQKPEKLLERILMASSNENSLVLDFFTGSATTIATAHKLGRKWLGVEMGDHFETVDLPRMKTVLFGKISGISKELEKEHKLKKGGFFKYFSLEQYEDSLRNMKYKDSSPNSIFDTRKAFGQYVFYADQKFAHVLEIEKDKLELDFNKLYPNIDFAETISNLLGLPIKRITENSVVLQDGDRENEIKTDYKSMNELEKLAFIKLLKPALWWGA